MSREYIIAPGVYVSETGSRQEILAPGVYVSETIAATDTSTVVGNLNLLKRRRRLQDFPKKNRLY